MHATEGAVEVRRARRSWRTPSPTSALDFSLRTKVVARTAAAVRATVSGEARDHLWVAKWVAASDFRQLTALPPCTAPPVAKMIKCCRSQPCYEKNIRPMALCAGL